MTFQSNPGALSSLEPAPEIFDGALDSYRRWMDAGQRALATQRANVLAVRVLWNFLERHDYPRRLEQVTREHVELWLVATRSTGIKISSINSYAANLRAFFNWCVEEGYLERSPMERIRRARAETAPPDVLSDAEIAALFKACEGKSFNERRDLAMMRLWYATGMRRGELAGIRVADVDLDQRLVTVTGKGRKTRHVRIGRKPVVALDRYLHLRRQHKSAAETDALWLGKFGPLSYHTFYQILEQRAEQAGIRRIHPHLWRHTMADRYLEKGGGEVNLEALMGWEANSPMLRRYGASRIASRARTEYDRLGLGDDL